MCKYEPISFILVHHNNTSPEVNSNFPSRVMFSWFTAMIVKGWKKDLEPGE